jgi:PAS domain S-box-containing protein
VSFICGLALSSATDRGFKVLIVDDSIDNLRFLANILTEQGHQVRKVLNGHMALTAAKSSPPDLVLLDINMPQMNGYEVCHALKADPATANIPVIFISALDDVLDRVRAYTVGGVDYIAKPFQFEEVVARISTQLRLQALSQAVKTATARAEQAEAHYQQLFERVSQGIYQLNADGTYRQVNLAFATMLGYPSKATLLEQIGNNSQALYVDPERWLTLMERLYDHQPVVEETSQVYQADGSIIEIVESLYPVEESAKQPSCYLGLARIPA